MADNGVVAPDVFGPRIFNVPSVPEIAENVFEALVVVPGGNQVAAPQFLTGLDRSDYKVDDTSPAHLLYGTLAPRPSADEDLDNQDRPNNGGGNWTAGALEYLTSP